ncbi:restriction endonuclease subunit S [Sorangium sp. So ce119]|uniref:restriction endonuclease subunit S n=1 Tax=Sorangium sp. So ce119 TaxID=3133279 RepID=UPI003F639551
MRTSRSWGMNDDPSPLKERWQYGRLVPCPEIEPKGWCLVRLVEYARLESGHTPSRRNPSYWNGGVPWLSLHDSKNLEQAVITQTSQTISELGLANSSARLLPAGTVAFSRTATVGKVTILGREMATSQDFANYVCGPKLHNRYLMQLFRFLQPEWSRLMAGSTHNTVYMPVFENLKILLPPIFEQKKIASILSSVDDTIEATQAVIDQLLVVKAAMTAELLTRGLPGRHTRFKRTEIGEVPEEWRLISLSDVTADGPTNGLYKPAHLIGRGTLVAGMTAIDGSTLRWDACRRAALEPAEIERFGLRCKDILITRVYARVDGIGRFVIVPETDEPVCYESNMMRIRIDPQWAVPEFVAFYMQLPQLRKQVEQRATLGAQASINSTGIRSLPLRLPPLEEQRGIVSVLCSVEETIDREQDKLNQLIAFRSALQSALLTGEIRVTPAPDEVSP